MTTRSLAGDARRVLAELADGSVGVCLTSPPYYGLRDYGDDDQFSLVAAPEAYGQDWTQCSASCGARCVTGARSTYTPACTAPTCRGARHQRLRRPPSLNSRKGAKTMRSTPEPVDPLLTRPLGDVHARRPAAASQAASASTPRRISESVFELDGKWFTKVPLPGQAHSTRLAADEPTGTGHGMAPLGRQLSRGLLDAGGQFVIVDKDTTAATRSQARSAALAGA